MLRFENFNVSNRLGDTKGYLSQEKSSNYQISKMQNLAYPNIANLKANFLTFKQAVNDIIDTNPIKESLLNFSYELSEIFHKSVENVKQGKSNQIDVLHLVRTLLNTSVLNLISYNPENKNQPYLIRVIEMKNKDLLKDEKAKHDIIELVKHCREQIDTKIATLSMQADSNNKIGLSPYLTKIINKSNQINIDEHFNGLGYKNIEPEDFVRHLLLDESSDNLSRDVLITLLKSLSDINDQFEHHLYNPDGGIINLSQVSPEKFINIDFYANKARTLATTLTPNRHAVITYEQGAMPELLVQSFVHLIDTNELKGFSKDSSISFIDFNKAISAGKNVNQVLDEIVLNAKKNPSTNYVIFISDFDQYYSLMLKKAEENIKLNPITQFKANMFGPNVHIVGLMEEPMYSILAKPNHPSILTKKISLSIKAFETVHLSSPSEQQSISMLQKNKHTLIQADLPAGIYVTSEAIEAAVKKAANIRSGSMPGKVIELIKFVALSKLHNSDNSKITIKPEDIESFAKEYPELKHPPESTSGTFSLISDTGIRLSDVGGASNAKEKLQDLLDFIKNPAKFKKTGAIMPKGYLLTGEPGNGKTYLAKAVAGEAKVPFISVSGSQFVEKYVGVGASRVRDLFAFAREQAAISDTKTAIIFIDEIDALTKARSSDGNSSNSEAEQTLNQLLVEMDGLQNETNTNIVVIGATNRPDIMDKALIDRPGRFDHVIEVPNPSRDIQSRYEILSIHARKIKIAGNREEILKDIAARTVGASSARLADIINKAAIIAAKDNREEVTPNDLIEAKLEAIAGPTNKINASNEEKKVLVSHEWGHAAVNAVMYDLINVGSQIDLVTLDSRGGSLAAVWFIPGDNIAATTETVIADIAKCLGGDSAEKVIFKSFGSSSIASDLSFATNTALTAIEKWGIGPNTGKVSINNEQLKRLYAKEIKQDMKLLMANANTISDRIVKFLEPFFKQQADEYYLKVGKGGNNLLGDEFRKNMFNWIEKSGKQQEYKELKQEFRKILDQLKKYQDPYQLPKAAFK